MHPLSFSQYSDYAGQGYGMVPLAKEFTADTETPISLYLRFLGQKDTFLLESVEGGEKWARYSFIGANPFAVFSLKNSKATLQFRDGAIEEMQGDPAALLRPLLKKYRSPVVPGLPRFTGGGVGFFAYDSIRYIEKLPDTCEDRDNIPDCHLLFTDKVVAFDHLRQTVIIIVNVPTLGDLQDNYQQALNSIEQLESTLRTAPEELPHIAERLTEESFSASCDQNQYLAMVAQAKEHILDGDIFQIVLSRRLEAKTKLHPFRAYRTLRSINPSPYMYYMNFSKFQVVGASPEMLVRVGTDGRVETCPIAGTRKRGANSQEDTALAAELLADEKEIAEHMMLVDLGRNDIGRVAQFGSVKVDRLKQVERYSHVMHIVSNVSGVLGPGKDALDALFAVMPAGTLSGAPKVRAMELIDELETARRGIYGGAAGYLGFDGSMDCCIIIRTFLFKDSKVTMQSGGGIVYDSVPINEFEEAQNKVRVLRQALIKAGEVK